jgi:hypothetical protein
MLELVIFILVSLISSVAAIWFWRLVSKPYDSKRSSLVKPATKTRIRLQALLGFMSSKNRNSKVSTKTPWGW